MLCPSCYWFVVDDATSCPECKAVFGPNKKWKAIPIPQHQDVYDLLESKLRNQPYISKFKLADLVRMAEDNLSLVNQRIGGDSLLHKAAEFGLETEIERLLALGADPCAVNRQGRRPSQVTGSDAIKKMLAAAGG